MNVVRKMSKYSLPIGALLLMLSCSFGILAQNTNPLQAMDTEVTAAKVTALNIIATICWIFLAVGIAGIIYAAVADGQRMKLSIITFVAAGLALTVGYAANIL